MKIAALAVAALLVPTLVDAPPRPPQTVAVSVGHDRATGFVAGEGRVVTVAHVLDGGEVRVDGRPATVLRVDARNDLALLEVAGVRGEPPRFGAGATSLLGRPAPVVRRIRARVDGGPARRALQIRAEVAIGESGAPLVTQTGRVAGVVFARSRDRERTAYAVDATAVAELIGRSRPS